MGETHFFVGEGDWGAGRCVGLQAERLRSLGSAGIGYTAIFEISRKVALPSGYFRRVGLKPVHRYCFAVSDQLSLNFEATIFGARAEQRSARTFARVVCLFPNSDSSHVGASPCSLQI
jgi:hypothetical protein